MFSGLMLESDLKGNTHWRAIKYNFYINSNILADFINAICNATLQRHTFIIPSTKESRMKTVHNIDRYGSKEALPCNYELEAF